MEEAENQPSRKARVSDVFTIKVLFRSVLAMHIRSTRILLLKPTRSYPKTIKTIDCFVE